MSYFEEFRSRLAARDYNKILVLWQEYCESDELDVEELRQILGAIRQSDFAKSFGQYVEAILPLIMTVKDEEDQFSALCSLYDLQTSNSQALYDLAREIVQRYSHDPHFTEKLRLVGLRTKENFQGALSNFRLLNHIKKGHFVLHTAGWGVGEIVDFSLIREQVTIEFENLHGGKKELSFKNAFRTIIPLRQDHFLVQRFMKNEALEKQASEDGLGLVIKILKELGPKTAGELKELLNDRLIPSALYSKWWQATRSRLKKDPHIIAPASTREPFSLRTEQISHGERYTECLRGKQSFDETLQALYSLVRDFPNSLKNEETRQQVRERTKTLLDQKPVEPIRRLLVHFFLEQLNEQLLDESELSLVINTITDLSRAFLRIQIVAFRKRFLIAIRQMHRSWLEIFLRLLDIAEPAQLKDYILKECGGENEQLLIQTLEDLRNDPMRSPEAFLWYFQKVASSQAPYLTDQTQLEKFFESFLILMAALEQKRDQKELVKRMHSILESERFKIVRDMLKNSSIVFAREFLLLASKCHTLSIHDQKTLRSLVEVVHGQSFGTQSDRLDPLVIWTTEEGYRKVRGKIEHLGTVEVVENAREIEAARAHGDLRENSEYKCALERRNRLQAELKSLSDQFNRARLITADDISTDTVSVGTRVSIQSKNGDTATYTILGPWDADPSANILSAESRLAQLLLGKKIGSRVEIKGENAVVKRIEPYTS
jgi:transcription elongation factor GreA-like protein/transcription elongation GreA/GreB family factor